MKTAGCPRPRSSSKFPSESTSAVALVVARKIVFELARSREAVLASKADAGSTHLSGTVFTEESICLAPIKASSGIRPGCMSRTVTSKKERA